MFVTTVLLVTVVTLLAKWVLDRMRRQRTFQDLGLPGPRPEFFMGNVSHMEERGSNQTLLDWSKKYGKTFGYYEGALPVFVTSDVDIIKHVLIKSFSDFHSRKMWPVGSSPESIIAEQGDKWKRLRVIIGPTFTARRMKEMSPLVNKCVSHLLCDLESCAKAGKAFNIAEDFQRLTLSAIACCGFGLDMDMEESSEHIFLKKCKEISNIVASASSYFKYLIPIAMVAPRVLLFLKWINQEAFGVPRKWFYDTAAAIIEARKGEKATRTDFVQLLLDAEYDPENDDISRLAVDVDAEGEGTQVKSSPSKEKGKGLTLKEMQAQCMTFLLAGYETSSTALSFAAHELAMNQDVQEKLQQEVDEHLSDDKLPDYMSVQKMKYMDMFLKEVLRLHPIAQIVTTRMCYNDVTIKGLRIPRDCAVAIHTDAVHQDPNLWGPEDPRDFVPERFLPERSTSRDSMAWLPFGGGPRNCVGMRFALMEIKITLARMLKDFTVVKCEETKVPLPVTLSALRRPSQGVWVRLEKRQR